MNDDQLSAYQGLVSDLSDDLMRRIERDGLEPELRAAWEDARAHDRTADSFTDWLEHYLEQISVAWVLTTIFVRYLEDNELVEESWLAGEGARGQQAEDHRDLYFQEYPAHSDTDYLVHVFRKLSELPAGELFGKARNPLYRLALTGDGGKTVLEFFRQRDDTGGLKYTFDTEGARTRFLGDLYQDLSEDARKRYALLQTPEFVEEFILDYTLEPAVEEFGLEDFRFIDPTCGSGHFLLGGFRRLLDKWQAARPDLTRAEHVRRALEATHGVDLNPFAVSIARFRLLVAALSALDASGQTTTLAEAPELPLKIATGDSLLHGRQFPRFHTDATELVAQQHLDQYKWDPEKYGTEDNDLIYGSADDRGIMMQQYHAVVGNPPYITVKDKAMRDAYRKHYASCYRSYQLTSPFFERFFDLAGGERLDDDLFDNGWPHEDAGYVGMIISNGFMKRSFGQKLVEEIIPHMDLSYVVDTSGAEIPGHGTPTVILFGQNHEPKSRELRAALGIRGEPRTPEVPAEGKVWTSIVEHLDEVEFENDFVSIEDIPREILHEHPWTLRGGGALDGKLMIEGGHQQLQNVIADIGYGAVTREDDAYVVGRDTCARRRIAATREFVTGENVRNWSVLEPTAAVWPYSPETLEASKSQPVERFLWRDRARLKIRSAYGKTQIEHGLRWFEYSMFFAHRYRTPLTITHAFVSTHNHFALDRGGSVFNRHAPMIKLPEHATEDDHLGLLGLLNSSTAGFWMQMVFHNKGGPGGARSKDEKWHDFYEHDGTKMKLFPVADERPVDCARRLDALGRRLSELRPQVIAERGVPTADVLDEVREESKVVLGWMIALQEELDWQCYEFYGLSENPPLATDFTNDIDDLPRVLRGERPFEIVLARKMEEGTINTEWFSWFDLKPRTDIPERWPEWYQELVAQRIERIERLPKDGGERFVRLIEKPEFKRRWNFDDWEDLERKALRDWLKNRLETRRYISQAPDAPTLVAANNDTPHNDEAPTRLMTVSELAGEAARDDDFVEVAERLTGDRTFDVDALVAELVAESSVPFLPSQRYTTSGRRRRREWEQVWELQRREDAGEDVGTIPKPPKYRTTDYQQRHIYDLRGKLDVPRERFTSYPGLEDQKGDQVITWAGLDHLQRAKALATFYFEARNARGWGRERLVPILAGLKDLLPWVEQWHSEPEPSTGQPFADFLNRTIESQAVELGVSMDEIEEARLG